MTKERKFVSANDIKWGNLNKQVLQCSKNSDWQGVLQAYEEMINILKEEGRDYSHIEESIEKTKRMSIPKALKRKTGNGCLLIIIIVITLIILGFIANLL